MATLREALDRSQSTATELVSSFFPGGFLGPDEVAGLVNETRGATIATVSDAGIPHASYVIAACLDEVIHFTVAPGSILERNIGHQPRIGFTIVGQQRSAMGQGDAVFVARSLEADDLLASLDQASGAGRFTPEGWDGSIYRIELRRLVAG